MLPLANSNAGTAHAANDESVVEGAGEEDSDWITLDGVRCVVVLRPPVYEQPICTNLASLYLFCSYFLCSTKAPLR